VGIPCGLFAKEWPMPTKQKQGMNVQALFDRYSRYWQGRLPRYTVTLSEKYHGGYCEKRKRKIYMLNSG
jgi:hypothetical protein